MRFIKIIAGVLFTTTLAATLSSTLAAKPIPAAPQLAAKSYIMLDAATGQIIHQSNADLELPPASLTKLMTSYIVERELAEGAIAWDDQVRVSVKAWKTEGSKMFIKEGTYVSVGELLRGVIIQSGNDASVALAEHVSGSEESFVDIMNQYAEILGMNNTHFQNSTGLPADMHYSTAADMAKLAHATITQNAEYYPIYAEKSMEYGGIKQPNRNLLLNRNPNVDGLKTGHTEAAGYCLVTSAKKGDMRLITAVFGTNSKEARAQETQKLLTYGFRYFDSYPLYEAGTQLTTAEVWYAENSELSVGIEEALAVTAAKGERDNLQADVILNENLEAPIALGQQVGVLTISLNGTVLVEKPVVALQAVEEGGLFSKLWDGIVLFFLGLF
jgi:serine-type D-Ala-D-Ala carboxypeptidase (penicillin-binding protein 5/6)